MKQRNEIMWNIINSVLAGSLVLLGSLTAGSFTLNGILASILAGSIVAVSKFKNYWDGEKGEYSTKAFTFVQ